MSVKTPTPPPLPDELEPTLRKEEQMSPTAKRTGLLALLVTFSAGIHAGLAPDHLKEMPPLGCAFIVAATMAVVLAGALVSRPYDRRIPLLAGVFCVGQIVTWVLFVTIRVPGFSGTPEPVDTIALVCKGAELLGVVIAVQLVATRRQVTQLRSVGV